MPFISVVVPVLGPAPRLELVPGPSDGDVEVIVVGRSSDGLPDDPRVRFVPAPTADEPGPAWAAGFEAARGEYAWFVDAAGDLADGALATAAARLHELRPDLLLIGHHGRTGPPVRLPAAGGLFTVAQRPDAFDSAPEAWARVVRRDLVARAGFPFHRGRYAEVTFSYPLLVAAERIAVLDRVCYHVADPAPGAGLGDTEAELEVFDQYERLFALLDRWGVDGRDARDRGRGRGPGSPSA